MSGDPAEKVKWGKGEVPGRVSLQLPFHGGFNAALKQQVPSAGWTYSNSRWTFDGEERDVVVALIEKYLSGYELHRVEWELKRHGDVIVDGCRLLRIERDWWRVRDSAVSFTIIDSDLKTGGSNKNSDISGRLVIEAWFRPGSEIWPEPVSMERLDAPTERNPLAHYPDSMLVEELKRRGIQVE